MITGTVEKRVIRTLDKHRFLMRMNRMQFNFTISEDIIPRLSNKDQRPR